MKRLIIPKYLSRKRNIKKKEAQKYLDRIEEFFENSPSADYDKGKLIFYRILSEGLRKEENPEKILLNVRKGTSREYWNLDREVGKFLNLSEDEKRARVLKQIREGRENSSYSLLEKWIKKAKSILEEIVEQNPEKMLGFEYYSHFEGGGYGEGAIYERIVRKDKEKTIYFQNVFKGKKFYVQPFSDYGDEGYLEETTSKSIASEILNQITLSRKKEGNIGRNQIVKKIEKRTGRNLKKDIAHQKRNYRYG